MCVVRGGPDLYGNTPLYDAGVTQGGPVRQHAVVRRGAGGPRGGCGGAAGGGGPTRAHRGGHRHAPVRRRQGGNPSGV
eukprot:6664940-Pyramimonas_sp.AAC.1